MNTPTPAQALGDCLSVIAPMIGKKQFTVTKYDDGTSALEGDNNYMAAVCMCLDLVIKHGQHFAWLENRAELLSEDIECFHMAMDDRGVPRDDGSNVYSMIGRVNKLVEAAEARVERLQAINAANAGELDGIRKLTAPLFNDIDPIHGVSSRAPNVSITPYGYVRDVVKQLEAAQSRARELESALACNRGLVRLNEATAARAEAAEARCAELERDNAIMRSADYHQVGIQQEQQIIDLEARVREAEGLLQRVQNSIALFTGINGSQANDIAAFLAAKGVIPTSGQSS